MRRIGLGVAAAALLVTLAAVTAGLVPVTYRVEILKAAAIEPIAGWERIGQPERARITVATEGPGTAIIGAPQLDWPERYDESLLTESDGFLWDPQTARFLSDGPGRLVFEGTFSDVHIPIVSGTTSERVSLERTTPAGTVRSQVRGRDVGESYLVVDLPSTSSQFARTASFLWRAGDARWSGPQPDRVSAWVAGRELTVSEQDGVPLDQMASAVLAALLSGIVVLAAAVVLVAVAWLAGAAMDPRGPPGLARQVVRVLLVLGAALAVGNGLSYVITARWAALIVAVAVLSVAAIGLIRSPRERLVPAARELAGSLPWVLIPGAILFFPLFVWGSWFAGAFKTDLFEYATLASIARDHSLLAMQDLPLAQASGTLTSGAGFAWRSIDSIGAAMVGQWFGIGSVAAIVVVALALFVVFGLAVLAMARTIGQSKYTAPMVALILLNPLFVGLFVEGYYSQYVFVALVPGLILVLDSLVRRVADGSPQPPDRVLLWTAAAVAAVMVAVYPYFFVVVAAGLALTALIRASWRRTALVCILPIGWRTLLLASLGLIPALNFAETEVYQEGLDAIARFVLLAPYSGREQAFLWLGFVPYQWREFLAPVAESMGGLGGLAWRLASGAGTVGVEMLVGTALLSVLLLLLSVPGRVVRSYVAFASAVIVGLWLAFGAYYLLGDRPYPMLKGLWTAAALFPLVLATASWRPRFQLLALGCLAVLALLWGRVIVADRVDWMLTRDSQNVAYWHSSIQPDLARVADVFAEDPSSTVLVRGPQPISGTDRDRVALAHIQVLARDAGIPCVGCDGNVPVSTTCEPEPEVVVLVGVSGKPDYCGRPLSFRTRVIEVFK